MTPEKLKQIKEIVVHFLGQTPTDEEILVFCTEKGFEGVDAGTLSDWTFQYNADELTADLLPKIGELLSRWTPPSGFTSSAKQQVAVNILSKDILALLEEKNTPFLLATAVLEALSSNLSKIIHGSAQRATDVRMAIGNSYLIRQFGKDPNQISVGDLERERKAILDSQNTPAIM